MTRSAELLDCRSLQPGSMIDVETKSRHYLIECLGGNSIRISGHPQFCPRPVVAQLEGSVTNEGALESGVIEKGTRLLFVLDEHIPITTSEILNLHLDESDGRPRGAYRVH